MLTCGACFAIGIGQQFALTEASYVTVRLLQKFDQIEGNAEQLASRTTSNLTLTNCKWPSLLLPSIFPEILSDEENG